MDAPLLLALDIVARTRFQVSEKPDAIVWKAIGACYNKPTNFLSAAIEELWIAQLIE